MFNNSELFTFDEQDPPEERAPIPFGARPLTVDQIWAEWFAASSEQVDEETFEAYKTVTAWRLVREAAVLRGIITSPRQTLLEVTRCEPSPWERPFHFGVRTGIDGRFNSLIQSRPTALLPPPPAQHAGETMPGYRPEEDETVRTFLEAMEIIAFRRLKIQQTKAGRCTLEVLLSPSKMQTTWPSAEAIMAFERGLVMQYIEWVYMRPPAETSPEEQAEAKLRMEPYNLSMEEIASVAAMARARMPELTGLDDVASWRAGQMAVMTRIAQALERRGEYRGAGQMRRDMVRLSIHEELVKKGTGQGDEDYQKLIEADIAGEDEKHKKLPPPDSDGILDGDTD